MPQNRSTGSTAEPAAKRRKVKTEEILKVIVGEGEESNTYTVPKSQLTKSSRFFQAGCQKRWVEGQKNEFTLLDHHPAHFEVYLHLLNTGSVVTANEELHIGHANPVNLSRNRLHRSLVKTYLSANYLDDRKSENAIIDALIARILHGGNYPSYCLFHDIYEGTSSGSVLRRLMVDFVAHKLYVNGKKDNLNDQPNELLVDLSLKLNKLTEKKQHAFSPRDASKCTYHVHDASNPKSKCGQ